MKKFAFTLAEVIITIAVIGVVATMMLPALNIEIFKSQVPPALFKAVNSFENATKLMLVDAMSDSLTSITSNVETFSHNLAKYMKVGKVDNEEVIYYDYLDITEEVKMNEGGKNSFSFDSKDKITYYIRSIEDDSEIFVRKSPNSVYSKTPNNVLIGIVYIDMNGRNTKPNIYGRDLFKFYMYNDGSLLPYGGSSYDKTVETPEDTWQTGCNKDAVTVVSTCAGSVWENKKVIYK